MIAPCVRVVAEKAEETRARLSLLGVLRQDLRPRRESGYVLLPVREDTRDLFLGYALHVGDFEEQTRRPGYKELARVPEELRPLLPTSFDVVGDVLVVKIPDELLPHAAAVGEALLAAHPSARVVAHDAGVKDEFRVRDVRVLAGEPRLRTVHRENGIELEVDLATCYFSPRLAGERARVAALVREGEAVLDLFAGVGPFAILLAKRARPRRVTAVDANPDAVALLAANARRNKVDDRVVPVLGDAAEVAANLAEPADRVLMNLPHSASRFLPAALSACAPEAVLHYHAVLEPPEVDAHVEALAAVAAARGWDLAVGGRRVVHSYSPRTRHFSLDFAVRRRKA
ncbi:MAG TPA: class I SAM-dependent methyltransferase family protein [Candidatus Thermoplasmatota archaeon]|nr:class I SAM-dependent methyltransferase family protein [Candidatus Thermoplasmatota archaeon]